MLQRCGPAPYLRRRFETAGVRRAMLYATARGVYELHLNGARVGDAVLAPGWTDYRTRIEYAAHDVTELVRDGDNVLAAIVGDGWWSGFVGFDLKRAGAHYGTHPELLCELHIEHEDGTLEVVAGDEDWRATDRADPLLRPAARRVLRRPSRARRVDGARIRRQRLACRAGALA